ncbi:unnamed protein product, partial [marine sediment metagenome]
FALCGATFSALKAKGSILDMTKADELRRRAAARTRMIKEPITNEPSKEVMKRLLVGERAGSELNALFDDD